MVLLLANVFPLFYAPLFMSEYVYAVFIVLSRANMFALFYVIFVEQCVCAVHGSFTSEYVYAVLCYFSRANVFTLFLVLSRANMFTLFYVILLAPMCLHCFMVLSRANVFTLFYVTFFSSECVYALFGTFASEYVCAVYVIFSRLSECVFAVLLYFHERMCLRCFMLFSSSNCVCAISWYFHERICLRCFWHLIICLRCYDTFFISEYVFAAICISMGMCAFLCEQCVCVFYFTFYGLMRSYCWCYFLVTGEIGVYEIFFFCLSCVWLNQIGVAALSVKIDALQKQVSADSVDRALECVRQLADRPVGLSDGTAIVAALESLADVSRSASHVDYKRHEAVLKQCRPLTHDPRLPAVVTQLLGDDENKKIAGQIQKILKSDHFFSAPQVHGSPFPPPAGVPGLSSPTGEWAWPIHSVWLWQL